MDNMFKLMGWWTGIFAVMFFVGDMCLPHFFLLRAQFSSYYLDI